MMNADPGKNLIPSNFETQSHSGTIISEECSFAAHALATAYGGRSCSRRYSEWVRRRHGSAFAKERDSSKPIDFDFEETRSPVSGNW